ADANAPQLVLGAGQAPRELSPGGAAVRGLVESTVRPVPGAVLPGTLPRGPQVGVECLRVPRVERERDRAGVLVLVQHLLPATAAIRGPEHAALLVWAIRMSEDGHVDTVRILRINEHGTNLLAVTKPQVLPALAPIDRFVDAVAHGQIGSLQPFAAAHVNDL